MSMQAQEAPTLVNGIEVALIHDLIGLIEDDTHNAEFQFKAANQWCGGGLNRSSIKEFYARGKEDVSRDAAFILDADEPDFLAGDDSAPNPVEYLLHALISCLTTTVVAHAAVRGIEIGSIRSELKGDIDVRGFLGLREDVRKGYNKICVTMTIGSEASASQLKELASFSPVYDVVSRAVPVELEIKKA